MKETPESLINAIITADDARRRANGLESTRAAQTLLSSGTFWDRVWIEPIFNVLGFLWGTLMYFFPWGLRRRFVQWVNLRLSGHPPIEDPHIGERAAETVRLARELREKTGRWPALFVLMSHPDTEGPHEWLRFEMVRQGFEIGDAYTEWRRSHIEDRRSNTEKVGLIKKCISSPVYVLRSTFSGLRMWPHPKAFVAIDPFALDTVSAPAGGFYAGWMHRIYLAWDRQPSTQSWIQKHFLLRHTGHREVAWRVLACLRKDVPVVMVLSGGLPYNARLLYAAREFVQRLSPARWTMTKRQAQLELMEILSKPEGSVWPADDGELPEATRQAIRSAMERWGVAHAKLDPLLQEFTEEFKLAVPHRARLFHVLSARLVGKGKPVILVRVTHQDSPPRVVVSSPEVLHA